MPALVDTCLKTDTGRDLVRAVEAVSEHKPFFTSKISEIVLDGFLKRDREPGPVKVRPSVADVARAGSDSFAGRRQE